ncbi:hypothetical protein [Thermomonospora umbrina]|uniref:Uncharacterized protein n=1 Tax=Thermomonospora umbrina TaxID=111806 RepID=A0A3D9SPG6_9ACTN|nr:hypothetical protein [Thermomonospora umbrina]REE97866.1 hypothetical protein DFJ69_3341 [Thermomonospora umbrina]
MAPPTPDFGPDIDAYAPYQPQRDCDPGGKPGVVEFRDLVLAAYPGTTNLGISRACGSGGQSEHKEGRAWDWGVRVNGQGHLADDLIYWLHATDRHGNRHALARRFGIMYMIWNRRIWMANRAEAGWQPYRGSSPHTDHIHFSFSWAGARKETTWWTRPPVPDRRQRLAVGMSADGRVELFHGAIDQIWHTYQHSPGGAWSGWQPFGGPAGATVALSASTDGRLELFAMNGEAFMHRHQTQISGPWAPWGTHGGGGDHLAVAHNHDGRLEVFASNPSGVHHRWQNTPGGTWHDWRPLGGPASARLAAAPAADGRIEVFAMNDDIFRHTCQTDLIGTWREWVDFGGGGEHLTLSRNHDGRLEVFATNPSGVHHRWQNVPSGDWHDWRPLGGPASARVASIESNDGRIEVFAMNDEVLRHNHQTDPTGTWREWVDLGGGGHFVRALRNKDGRLEIFANNDGGVHHRWQNTPNGTWHDWRQL